MEKPTSDRFSSDHEFESFSHPSVSTIERTDIQRLSMIISALVIMTCSAKWFMSRNDRTPAVRGSVAMDSQTGFKVDVNRASVDELSLLPQVGPKLAASIVSEREQRGKFLTINDLDRASGVGPERVAQLGPLLEISD